MSAPAPTRRAQSLALLRQALSLRGRLRRRGFWLTGLSFVVVLVVLIYVSAPLLQFLPGRTVRSAKETASLVTPVTTVAELVLAWPATAALIRRGHDRGYPAARTGAVWTVFVALGLLAPVLPFTARLAVQTALLVYFIADYGCTPGERAPNRYGADPRRPASEASA